MAAMRMSNPATFGTPGHEATPYCCPATSSDVPGIADLHPEHLHA